jgi:nucleoside-diphosphate-sugar epimerase
VLIPDAPDIPVQVLDVRDLAAWLVRGAEQGSAGIANAGGPTHTLGEHLEAVRTVTGFTGSWEVVGEDWLAAHDVEPWMGPRSLPLWLPAESIALNAHDLSRAASLGLHTRPLAETLADTLEWELAEPGERRAVLTDEDERALLAALDDRS